MSPPKSQDQRQAAAIALKIKQGERSGKNAGGAAKQMAESMSTKQLREYAKKPGKSNKS